jgi:hypothetical protein
MPALFTRIQVKGNDLCPLSSQGQGYASTYAA